MRTLFATWQVWALLSAGFAALTAIFAKIGIENVNSDFATFIRTIVILCAFGAILIATGPWQSLRSVSSRSYAFLILSGFATGGSWICSSGRSNWGPSTGRTYDKMSVVLVAVFGVAFLGEKLSTINWAGVALIAAGAVMVAFKG